MVTIAQAQAGILKYIERNIAPSLSMLEKVVVGGTMNLVSDKLPEVIDKYADNKFFCTLGVYDKEHGEIDVDALYNAVTPYIGVDPIPLDIPIVKLKLKITRREVDDLYRYIKEA